MTDEYMKKYCEQMDKITLSDDADRAILDDLLKSDTRKGVSHMKRFKWNMSAAMIAVIIIVASSITVFAGVAIHRAIIQSEKKESRIKGFGVTADVGESYYYDLLAGSEGEVYVLTNNDYKQEVTEHHAIAWRSKDEGDTWEEVLSQPEQVSEESYLIAGELNEGDTGIEAIVIMEEESEKADGGFLRHVYRIREDYTYEEYDMDEVYEQLGGQESLWTVGYVNAHMIALGGSDKYLLYDMNTQKVVKSLPYDLTMGRLTTRDQFLLYGREIYTCLDADTLEEQTPEEGLQEFVKEMYKKNEGEVLPPMAALDDTVICITKSGIFEYQNGNTTQVRQISENVNKNRVFNGLLPFCKTRDGDYYMCAFDESGMALWKLTVGR